MKTLAKQIAQKRPGRRLMLTVATAQDLMTPNPVSLSDKATLREAAAVLTEREISAVRVIDDAGRPVGVLSRADIVRHDRENVHYLAPAPEYYEQGELTLSSGETLTKGFQVQSVERTAVREVMTPTVISVPPNATASRVVGDMLAFKVHRVFVVDDSGVLIGVISTFDILRQLRPEGEHP